jgi:hypothetical protein
MQGVCNTYVFLCQMFWRIVITGHLLCLAVREMFTYAGLLVWMLLSESCLWSGCFTMIIAGSFNMALLLLLFRLCNLSHRCGSVTLQDLSTLLWASSL